MAPYSSIVWRIPFFWREEPGGYSPWGQKELDMTEATEHIVVHGLPSIRLKLLSVRTHTHTHTVTHLCI